MPATMSWGGDHPSRAAAFTQQQGRAGCRNTLGPAGHDSCAAVFHLHDRLFPQIAQEPLPSEFLLRRLNFPAFHYLFQMMIFLALLESGTGCVHAINERVAEAHLARSGRALSKSARLWITAGTAVRLDISGCALRAGDFDREGIPGAGLYLSLRVCPAGDDHRIAAALRGQASSQRRRFLISLTGGRAVSASFGGMETVTSPCSDSNESSKLSSGLEQTPSTVASSQPSAVT